ncbi:MAG: hypothetical protein GTO14_19230 [Anaerolineales bacterium]|nr:hypothetical protein [Anaerolineales bacterium]
MLEIRMLGTFDVRINGEPIEIPSRPAQSLLAYLVLNSGNRFRREKLAGMLWPDSDEANARGYLRHALWRLRKALGDEAFHADKVTIAFNENIAHTVDVFILDEEIAKDPILDSLQAAISVYGGELLPGFYENWVVLERERLRATFDQKMQSLLDALVENGRWTGVLEWGERWIALGHVPEPAYRALMIANSALGDSAKMAAVYRRCSEVLETELGVEPSEQTKQLYERLSRGEVLERADETVAPIVERDASSAVKTLLSRWREKGIDTLDLGSLAIVHAARREMTFEPEEVDLMIRSALHHGVDIEPWLSRADSASIAVAALEKAYLAHPKPRVRMQIVEALGGFESDLAVDALLRIVESEDAASVRSQAAIAVANMGKQGPVVDILLRHVQERDSSAMTALVAIADEVGLPERDEPYPRLSLGANLALRRWLSKRNQVGSRTVRGAGGALIAGAIMGAFLPFISSVVNNEYYQAQLQFMSLTGWVITAAVGTMVWSGIQGLISTLAVGMADVFWRGTNRKRMRLVLGALSGLTHAGLSIVFAVTGLLEPAASPQVYVPIYILYGTFLGIILTMIIPEIDTPVLRRDQIIRALLVATLIILVAIPTTYVLYSRELLTRVVADFLYALALSLGLGFSLSER